MNIDHEIISTAILLPSAYSRWVVVSYKRKYVHEVLVNRLVKLAQEKKCGYVNLTIAVDWDVKNQTKPNIPAVDNINHVMRKPASGKCEQQ